MMSQTGDDLQACAMALEGEFCEAYRHLSGGIYMGDLLLVDVFYRLLAAGVIEVGPGLSKNMPLLWRHARTGVTGPSSS